MAKNLKFIETARCVVVVLADGEAKADTMPDAKTVAPFHWLIVYYAIDNQCSRMGFSLVEGTIKTSELTCDRHGRAFDFSNEWSLPPAHATTCSTKIDQKRH